MTTVLRFLGQFVVLVADLWSMSEGIEKRSDDVQPLEAVVSQLSADLQALQASHSALQNTVDRLNQNVAFRVGFQADTITGLGHNLVVKFPDIYLNEGNGYDHVTGHFSAPVSGTYAFFLRVQSFAGKHIHMAIFHEGTSPIGYDYVDDDASYETAATMGAVALRRGEKVWIQVLTDDVDARGGDRTLFTGFLLHPDVD